MSVSCPSENFRHHLAIIVYRVRRQGLWEDEGSLLRASQRVCREVGGRIATKVLVRDLDLPVAVNNARRLEAVVDGLPLHGGAQLAV